MPIVSGLAGHFYAISLGKKDVRCFEIFVLWTKWAGESEVGAGLG